MVEGLERQASNENILQFVDHVKEVMARITRPTSEKNPPLQELPPGFEPRERLDPAAFHRMGNLLYEKKNPTMGDISQALRVPLSTATRMANWWVDNGYAQRLSDPDDRRIVRLTLTDEGQALLEAIQESMIRNVQRVLKCLTPEEQTILITLSGKVAASLEEPES